MYRILELNPQLQDFSGDIDLRMSAYHDTKKRILPNGGTLNEFSNAHEYFGIHHVDGGWVYREWAPEAHQLYLEGEFNDWNPTSHPLTKLENGVWELKLKGEKALWDGCKVKTVVDANMTRTEHIPLYARRVVQDKETITWCAEVVDDWKVFKWTDQEFKGEDSLYIYEAHVGMAQEEGKVGSYRDFAKNVLPRIKRAGYNTIQLMAIMEHPYYGSFGYQVSSFYAASSWFGKPADLKYLVNKAHKMGIRVLLDLVHSHAVKNTAEGINMFDGTTWQFFHDGEKGDHPAWGTKCFNYGKTEVIHFLLSNLKFWMKEYHFDGFRFDGVTSMIYHHHGYIDNFGTHDNYFGSQVNEPAITYLMLANDLIHTIKPASATIAEEVSGMPGIAIPITDGGIGFDYRMAMAIPDYWITLLKDYRDEDWNMYKLWNVMNDRIWNVKTVAYCESHDQAMVGDQTIAFRLMNDEMYYSMEKEVHTINVDRGVALHKMIRLFTLLTGGQAYLNFMGNEFGHPDWIDFPRKDNDWSYRYARRLWHLIEDGGLKYNYLLEFDKAMLQFAKSRNVMRLDFPNLLLCDEEHKTIAFGRNHWVAVFNWHPMLSEARYIVPVKQPGKYRVVLSTDDERFGGFGRINKEVEYLSHTYKKRHYISVYNTNRSANIFERID